MSSTTRPSASRIIAALLLPLSLAAAGCGGGGGGSANAGNVSPGSSATPPPSNSTPGNGNSSGNGSGDKQPPSIVKTTPDDRSDKVTPSSDIVVSFDEALEPASVAAAGISLRGPSGNVDFDIEVNDTDIVLIPATDLEGGASYTVTVGSGITDLAGNAMDKDHNWQFLTANGVCSNFYSSDFSLIEGTDNAKYDRGLAKPAKGVPYRDPSYGSCVVRIADHEKEGLARQSRNYYSRIQPFNADDSYVLVHSPAGEFHIYDAQTTDHVRELSLGGASVEPQWHPANPEILYVLPNHGGMTITQVNVNTDDRKVVADFRKVKSINGHPGATSIHDVWPGAAHVWTHWEGSPSRDARYWGFIVENGSGQGIGMITYDLKENAITGTFDFATQGNGAGAPDHISMSPSGKYIVPSWAGKDLCLSRSQLGTRNNPCGVMAYSRDFSSAVGINDRSPHSDIGIDENGRDVIVLSDYITGWVEMYDLETGQGTRLFQIYVGGNSTAMHVSAKSYDKPGWVLISTYKEKFAGAWYENKLIAVEMKANPRILNIAHSYNRVEAYYSETHAAVNRDFTRISFNSNWNTGNLENIDAYMVVLPKNAVPYQ